MQYRTFGRLGWKVSEIGYGMWGMGGQWKGGTDEEAVAALIRADELGCAFFDTAWIYGEGHSEELFGRAYPKFSNKKVRIATKIPPKNLKWPARPKYDIRDTFPPEHIIQYAKKSLKNLGTEKIDLLQLHVWDDSWADKEEWQKGAAELKKQGIITGFGISINSREPENVLKALKTGLIDSIQVIYNIFDQAPEDKLFPVCKKNNIAVIARVPLDEGTLSGTLTNDTRFDPDDWRAKYFSPENLRESVKKAEALKKLLPDDITLPQLALKFILQNKTVSTIIPGMRRVNHVEANMAVSDGSKLPAELLQKLKKFRWDRKPYE